MKTAEEMKREQKEVKLRMILQDYHRRNDYELQQAVNDILALDPLPPAEGAKKVQWSGYGELGNISQKPLQPTAEGAEEILASLVESLGEPDNSVTDHSYEIRPLTVEGKREWWMFHNGVGSGELLKQWLGKFATLRAQKIADKMVSERLREELMAYDKFLSNTYWGVSHIVKRDEAVRLYLKSREK